MAQYDVRALASEMPKTVRDFANYKLAIENCSRKTVFEYLLDLRTFFRFLLAVRSGMPTNDLTDLDISGIDLNFVRDISTTDIYEFLMYAGDERGNEWSAKSRKLSAIKAYFKFLCVNRF